MIDWKSKLTSRKFWAAICSLITNMVLAFGGSQGEATKITAIIMAGAAVIAYIIGEGLIDAKSAGGDIIIDPDDEGEAWDEAEEES